MTKAVKRLLELLADDKWHTDLPKTVKTKTVNLCIEQGVVRTKRQFIKRTKNLQVFRVAVRITTKGKKLYCRAK